MNFNISVTPKKEYATDICIFIQTKEIKSFPNLTKFQPGILNFVSPRFTSPFSTNLWAVITVYWNFMVIY
jgi:hypothetical protein